ncbi:lysine-specific histone demethylase 1 homolog 1 [Elysia marginata]|uniref:Lysine-specific histone demethylase 1 homolog 1 n=1 Tax=Elysia marginata TaxID=1093978 RepID=A0AAV4H8A7_9GAST|nr:lysine-specific histone demethylase 1 homolog 1 [Elysia marginata]
MSSSNVEIGSGQYSKEESAKSNSTTRGSGLDFSRKTYNRGSKQENSSDKTTPTQRCSSKLSDLIKNKDDTKTMTVTELLRSQSRESEELKLRNQIKKRDERYPSEYAAGKLTDFKKVKVTVEKFVEDPDMSEETLKNLTSQYLSQVGSALTVFASMERKTPLVFDSNSLLDTCIIESCNSLESSVKSAMRFINQKVHKRRPFSPRKPILTVPSHIVHTPPKATHAKEELRENLTTLLRSRLARRNREAASASKKYFRSLEMDRRLENMDQLQKISHRQALEQRLTAEAERALNDWHTAGVTKLRSKVKIVVVGAGLAGLSAAEELLGNGFKDIIVLEASDRVGGRLHSVCLHDCDNKVYTSKARASRQSTVSAGLTTSSQYAELGAPAWVYEDPTHAVFELARDRELITRAHRVKRPQCQVMAPDGKQLDERFVSCALSFCAHSERDTQILASSQHGRSSLAYSDYSRVRRRHLLAGMNEINNDLTLALDSIATIWRLASGDSEGDMAADLRGQHAVTQAEMAIVHDIDIPSQMVAPALKLPHIVKGCYRSEHQRHGRKYSYGNTAQICSSIMHKFPSGMIRRQQRVRHVKWSSFCNETIRKGGVPNIKIICGDGKVYYADHVIMAVPLGHLKKFADEMFEPTLPQYKLDVIHKMGVGTVSKIVLFYRQPPWKEPFHLIWAGKKPGDNGYVADSLCSRCLQLRTSAEKSHVLEVTFLGEIPEVAAKDDAHVAKKISFILKCYLTQSSRADLTRTAVPPPDMIVRSSWGRDPLYLGSHPYLRRGCEAKDVARLASSVNFRNRPVIQFAGDYTWSDLNRLTHAARSSGLREAQRLANFYCNYFGYENTNPFSTRDNLDV